MVPCGQALVFPVDKSCNRGSFDDTLTTEYRRPNCPFARVWEVSVVLEQGNALLAPDLLGSIQIINS